MKTPTVQILQGDCLDRLCTLPDQSVNCCVTSPPYWGLRDYGVAGQIGLEKTPAEYVAKMVEVFREVRRVLRDDGTLWLNLGDSYCSQGGLHDGREDNQPGVGAKRVWRNGSGRADGVVDERGQRNRNGVAVGGLAPKNLIGIPWRVAFALQADGWYLRSDIIWHKPNPMPESVTDRPTKAHEYIFLLSKNERYYYDSDAIKEPVTGNAHARGTGVNPKAKTPGKNSRIHQDRDPNHSPLRKTKQNESFSAAVRGLVESRNKRSVWTVATAPYREAHFATYPPDLIKPCIFAGCPTGGVTLDPFCGSGTTGQVALELGRNAILIELNPEYAKLIEQRTNVTPAMF
jgi:DNA modification methylase